MRGPKVKLSFFFTSFLPYFELLLLQSLSNIKYELLFYTKYFMPLLCMVPKDGGRTIYYV